MIGNPLTEEQAHMLEEETITLECTVADAMIVMGLIYSGSPVFAHRVAAVEICEDRWLNTKKTQESAARRVNEWNDKITEKLQAILET